MRPGYYLLYHISSLTEQTRETGIVVAVRKNGVLKFPATFTDIVMMRVDLRLRTFAIQYKNGLLVGMDITEGTDVF